MKRNCHLQALLELKAFGLKTIPQLSVLLALSELRSSLEIAEVTGLTRNKVWSGLRAISELVDECPDKPDSYICNPVGRSLAARFTQNTSSVLHEMGVFGLSNFGILLSLDEEKSLDAISREVELSPATIYGIISTMPDLACWEYAVEGRRGGDSDRIFFRSEYAERMIRQCLGSHKLQAQQSSLT